MYKQTKFVFPPSLSVLSKWLLGITYKEVMFLVVLVCLLVSNITQKVMNGLR